MKTIFLIVLLNLTSILIYAQQQITNDIFFFAYYKSHNIQLASKETSEFLQRYYYEEFNKNAKDEFARKLYVDKKTIQMQKAIDTLSFTKTYKYKNTFTFGEYDFEKKGFPLIFDNNFTNGYINPDEGYSVYEFYGQLNNIKDFMFLPMEPEKAQKLVNQLKVNGMYGKEIKLNFIFNLTGKVDFYDEGIISAISECKLLELNINIKNFEQIKIKK